MIYQSLMIRMLLRIISFLYILTGNEKLMDSDVLVIEARKFIIDARGKAQ